MRGIRALVLAVAMFIGAGSTGWASQPASPAWLATFTVPNPASGMEEKYNVRLTEQADIDTARGIFSGALPRKIPVGRIIRGSSDVNHGYSWHIDPKDFTFGDYALKLCDTVPSAVESGEYRYSHLCPWSARLVGLSQNR